MSRSNVEDGGVGDALDDDRQAQAGAQLEHRPAHRAAGRVVLDVGQEVLVHLEHVDGHADEVGQRGPAGAEVVDGDADAELAQDGEVLETWESSSRTDSVISTIEPRRGQAAGLQGADDVGHELAAAHLAGGDVDGDAEIGVAEGGDGGAGLAQHPAAEVGDQRRLLGQRHELGGGDVAEQRVPPAQQGLDGDGAVHDDVDDGLEHQPQLAAVQGAVEVGAQGLRGGPARCAGRRRSGARSRGRRCGRCGGRGRRGAVPRRCRRPPSGR